MNIYPRGSEWRKWDLHVHAPGTKLNDGYTRKDGAPDLQQFCEAVYASDVSVIAVADYFSFDAYFQVKDEFERLHPDSDVLILPNLEVRLPVAVNRDEQSVNLHLIFTSDLSRSLADKFLGHLKTAGTTGSNRRAVTCAELESRDDFQSATVSLEAIDHAIKETFGEHATAPSNRQDFMIVVASAKGDGIRAGGNGIHRKKLMSDEIDKYSDAFFANVGSREYFLSTDRLEQDEAVAAKPVFDGCDAHSFQELHAALGKHVSDGGQQRTVTWIKADPTYAGLLQTLIEPTDRVFMGATEPDQKEPYKVISRVTFSGEAFPTEVVFNRNLNAIIGSRSSGKSSLLAHIAHAVDAEETVRLQVEAHGLRDGREAGPAAGFQWDDAGVECSVEWESGEGTAGKVIYIPQNSLNRLSQRPEEITRKIAPALFRTYPSVKSAFDRASADVSAANAEIRHAVIEWYSLAEKSDEHFEEIRDLGDKAAIVAERDRLQEEIDRIKVEARLTDDEVAEYQRVAGGIDSNEKRLQGVAVELDQLSQYVSVAEGGVAPVSIAETVHATVAVRPTSLEVPETVSAQIDEIRDQAAREVVADVERALVRAVSALIEEETELRHAIVAARTEHAELISKHEANEELAKVVNDHKKQVAGLEEIARQEASRDRILQDQARAVERIVRSIATRANALSTLVSVFDEQERSVTGLKFGIEIDVPDEDIEHATMGFSQRSTNNYIKAKGDLVSFRDAQANPAVFLRALETKSVTLNKGYVATEVAGDVLSLTGDIRFSAELDSDRIGGFSRSSMTPGKQALFALTLILNESQEPWPLLIDQPEDDLDSRSIYDTIVPYLVERKKERQIIMVSHNANLVIGADSEEVIVANRHGEDRKNKDEFTFDYLTGSLEHSRPLNPGSLTALDRFGVREHACEILDGGEEAFEKRRNKYNI